MKKTTIVWFKKDLRLKDNQALLFANQTENNVLPVYILDETIKNMGGASKWWLHHSLVRLNADLQSVGSRLILRRGPVRDVMRALCAETSVDSITWLKAYTPDARIQEEEVTRFCQESNIRCQPFKGNVLFEPGEIMTQKDTYFSVYTPFWNALSKKTVDNVLPKITRLNSCPEVMSEDVNSWGLLEPWSGKLDAHWRVGEAYAQDQLRYFLDQHAGQYNTARDIPGVPGTSMLSPYLHFGQLSVRDIWHQAVIQQHIDSAVSSTGLTTYLKELVWREFSYHLYTHQPRIQTENFRQDFDGFPWLQDSPYLSQWKQGQTGYPIVDAGMRQLWQTGWMHNRVRMVVASFLTKNMLVDWRVGEAWFWDTLVDADQASNCANWQWVAGCGADASPYFRIFNPVLQGSKFDASGRYIRQWVPELARLPDKFIHAPFEQDPWVLSQFGVTLGKTYPAPILELSETRNRALSVLKQWAKPGTVLV